MVPIWDKYFLNTYLLNLIPSKDWIVCVGAYCIRPTNAHYHEKMIDPLDTFRGICNTLLHMPYKYLINKYLLNPIPGKDWMVCIGAYYIRPTNAHDYRQMIDPPDTFQSVCNTTLPIRDKNLIPLWTMNLIPGTCWGVCNTPILIRIKNLIPLWTINLKLGTCLGVCNTPLPIRIKNLIPIYWVYLKLGRFLGVCLCDQLHLGGKLLKFVWEHVKPAEDRMGVTNATQTSTSDS